MKLRVLNPTTGEVTVIDVPRTEFVAGLKHRFGAQKSFSGDPNNINLVFRGRPLEDIKQLKDYGIDHDSVLAHLHDGDIPSRPQGSTGQVPAEAAPRVGSGVDYAAINKLLQQAHAASLSGQPDREAYSSVPADSDWDPAWRGGRSWVDLPPVLAGHTGVRRGDVLQGEDEDERAAYTDDDAAAATAAAGRYGGPESAAGSGETGGEEEAQPFANARGYGSAFEEGENGGYPAEGYPAEGYYAGVNKEDEEAADDATQLQMLRSLLQQHAAEQQHYAAEEEAAAAASTAATSGSSPATVSPAPPRGRRAAQQQRRQQAMEAALARALGARMGLRRRDIMAEAAAARLQQRQQAAAAAAAAVSPIPPPPAASTSADEEEDASSFMAALAQAIGRSLGTNYAPAPAPAAPAAAGGAAAPAAASGAAAPPPQHQPRLIRIPIPAAPGSDGPGSDAYVLTEGLPPAHPPHNSTTTATATAASSNAQPTSRPVSLTAEHSGLPGVRVLLPGGIPATLHLVQRPGPQPLAPGPAPQQRSSPGEPRAADASPAAAAAAAAAGEATGGGPMVCRLITMPDGTQCIVPLAPYAAAASAAGRSGASESAAPSAAPATPAAGGGAAAAADEDNGLPPRTLGELLASIFRPQPQQQRAAAPPAAASPGLSQPSPIAPPFSAPPPSLRSTPAGLSPHAPVCFVRGPGGMSLRIVPVAEALRLRGEAAAAAAASSLHRHHHLDDDTEAAAEAVQRWAAEHAASAAAMRAAYLKQRAAQLAAMSLVPRAPTALVQFGRHHDPRAAGAGTGGSTSPGPSGRPGIHVRPPTRLLRHMYVAQVGRLFFKALHRMEGRWTGEAQVFLPPVPNEAFGGGGGYVADTRVCTVSLVYDEAAAVWRETQSLTTRDGLVSSQSLVLRPVADGECSVELTLTSPPHAAAGRGGGKAPDARSSGGASPPFAHSHGGMGRRVGPAAASPAAAAAADFEMVLREQSDSVLMMTAYSTATGRPVLIETTTLVSDMRRVRTVQRFAETTGAFQCLYLITEERVLDTVTGAVMEPPRGSNGAPRARGGSGVGMTGDAAPAGYRFGNLYHPPPARDNGWSTAPRTGHTVIPGHSNHRGHRGGDHRAAATPGAPYVAPEPAAAAVTPAAPAAIPAAAAAPPPSVSAAGLEGAAVAPAAPAAPESSAAAPAPSRAPAPESESAASSGAPQEGAGGGEAAAAAPPLPPLSSSAATVGTPGA